MFSQEAKNLDFHAKPPGIFNVGKIIHILKNSVQAKENIDSKQAAVCKVWLKPIDDPPSEEAWGL